MMDMASKLLTFKISHHLRSNMLMDENGVNPPPRGVRAVHDVCPLCSLHEPCMAQPFHVAHTRERERARSRPLCVPRRERHRPGTACKQHHTLSRAITNKPEPRPVADQLHQRIKQTSWSQLPVIPKSRCNRSLRTAACRRTWLHGGPPRPPSHDPSTVPTL